MTIDLCHRILSCAAALVLASGCVITNDDGDSAGDAGTAGDDGPADDGGSGDDAADDGADDAPADDGADDDGADDAPSDDTGAADDGGASDGPTSGSWLYEETGGTTNGCTFIEDPSNGFGEFSVMGDGAGGFTITPGDGTAPFQCTHDGATFACAERLQEEMEMAGTTLQVLVSAEGDLPSASEMIGTQDGRIVCEGADCATVEAALGTTFPCDFSVPWQGTLL